MAKDVACSAQIGKSSYWFLCGRPSITKGDISLCRRHFSAQIQSARAKYLRAREEIRCEALKRVCGLLASYGVSVWLPGVTTDILEIPGTRQTFRLCEKHRDMLVDLLKDSTFKIVENDKLWDWYQRDLDTTRRKLNELISAGESESE